ncbi:MAG: DegT/DnrJ/EryC1/StrS family aminotransferase [Actinomycetia bacterium]|nr:DegT/DnrJ/EryC1/StrS family aminotransferase [Actinomycetes bacterium]
MSDLRPIRIEPLATEQHAFRRRFFWYPSARSGFGALLDSTASTKRERVLLPAFIGWSHREGSGVLDPVTSRGIPHSFYRMGADLRIDLTHLEELLQRHEVRLLVIIHFFGYVDPGYRSAVDLAQKHGAWVLEDEAHALYTDLIGGLSGSLGNAAVYSLHKMLPLPIGGMLVLNGGSNEVRELSPAGDPDKDVLWGYDLARIAQQRVTNALLLAELIGPLNGDVDLLWPKLEPGVVPQTLPVLVRSVPRDLLYEHMNNALGGVVTLYHTLVDGITLEEHPESHALSRRIMNLPVHQDLGPAEIHAVASQLAASVEALRDRGPHDR